MNEQAVMVQHRLDAAQVADLLGGLSMKGKLAPTVAPSSVAAKPAALPDGLDKAGLAFLADPRVRIGVSLVSPGNVRNLVVYGAGDGSPLVGFTPLGTERYSLAMPLAPDHIIALLVTGLGLEQDIAQLPLATTLDSEGLLALAGFADALRQRELEALLARLPKPESRVSLEEIYLRTLDGMVSGDTRWTTGLLTQLFDRLPELDEEKLRQGMLALQQIGWVTNSAGTNWMPTDAFALGSAHWQLPLAGAYLQLARVLNDSVETTDIVLLRMLGSVWLCRQQGKQYTLESTSSSHLLSFLDNVLAGFTVLPQPMPTASVVESVSAAPRSRPRFCRKCGAPLAADIRFCGACGNAVS